MRTRIVTILALGTLTVLAAAVGYVRAQESNPSPPIPAPARMVGLDIGLRAFLLHGQATARPHGLLTLAQDYSMTGALHAIDPPSCASAFHSWTEPESSAAVSWPFEARLVSLEGDTATVDLRWARHVTGAGVLSATSMEQRQTLTLREGE